MSPKCCGPSDSLRFYVTTRAQVSAGYDTLESELAAIPGQCGASPSLGEYGRVFRCPTTAAHVSWLRSLRKFWFRCKPIFLICISTIELVYTLTIHDRLVNASQ